MGDDDDSRLGTILGVVLVAFIAFQLVVVAMVFLNPPSESDTATPESTWQVERINASHVRIVHAGGSAVAAANLTVTVNGYERHVHWPDPVTEGDGAVVAAEPGGVVRLYWTGGEGNRALLAQWETP